MIALASLFFVSVVCADVDSDGTYVLDWFNRPGPEMGDPDYINKSVTWKGGAEDLLELKYGFLNMYTTDWGTEESVYLEVAEKA